MWGKEWRYIEVEFLYITETNFESEIDYNKMYFVNLRGITKKISLNIIFKSLEKLKCNTTNIQLIQNKAIKEEQRNKEDITHIENKK